jgi:hypothetical protein
LEIIVLCQYVAEWQFRQPNGDLNRVRLNAAKERQYNSHIEVDWVATPAE